MFCRNLYTLKSLWWNLVGTFTSKRWKGFVYRSGIPFIWGVERSFFPSFLKKINIMGVLIWKCDYFLYHKVNDFTISGPKSAIISDIISYLFIYMLTSKTKEAINNSSQAVIQEQPPDRPFVLTSLLSRQRDFVDCHSVI